MPLSPMLTRRAVLGQVTACLVALPARAELPSASNGSRILEAREGALRLLPEPAALTPVTGYDGLVPGPLLRYAQGTEIALRLVNKLDEPVTLSVQGLRVPNAMDGVAGLTQPAIAPGAAFDYRFPARSFGLSWYHSHVVPKTAAQIGRGLYGALVVDEPRPPVVDRDMLVLLAGWTLDGEGKIAGDGTAESDRKALLTVNSRPVPLPEVLAPGSRLRLRIASAVTSRVLVVGFRGAKPLILAVDGTPCPAFEPARGMVPVGPGALFDVMLDLPREPGATVEVFLREEGEPVLVVFRSEGATRADLPPIASLDPDPTLPSVIKLEAAKRADLVIEADDRAGTWKLNGVAAAGFPTTPLLAVKRGTPVSLGFVNRTSTLQQMRVHGHYVRLLYDLDDGWDPYWRTCVPVPAGRTKRIAFLADNPGKWAIEATLGEARSFGLATWFEVV